MSHSKAWFALLAALSASGVGRASAVEVDPVDPLVAEDAPEAPIALDGAAAEPTVALSDAALAAAEAESESIAARLRRTRSTRGRASLLPRVSVWLSFARGAPARLDRSAAEPDGLGWSAREGLAWAIVATWGAP